MIDPPARTEAEAIAQHAARVQEYIRKTQEHVCEHPDGQRKLRKFDKWGGLGYNTGVDRAAL
jgi:hypothetical protein